MEKSTLQPPSVTARRDERVRTKERQRSPKRARLPGLEQKLFSLQKTKSSDLNVLSHKNPNYMLISTPLNPTAQKRKVIWRRSPDVVCNYPQVSGTGGREGSPLGLFRPRTESLRASDKTLSILFLRSMLIPTIDNETFWYLKHPDL